MRSFVARGCALAVLSDDDDDDDDDHDEDNEGDDDTATTHNTLYAGSSYLCPVRFIVYIFPK